MAITPKMVKQRLPFVWKLFEQLSTHIAQCDPAVIFLPSHLEAHELEQIKSAFSCQETRLALESAFGFRAELFPGHRVAAYHTELFPCGC
ncbi:hypothetical protein IT407_03450 [Candidatus Uhrbacteria bacterium]|nr:hypothetical protein [Candidatus Uhrbacteria bacterium]